MFHSFRRICAILPGIMLSTPHIEKHFTASEVGDRASRVPVSRATAGTMSNRVCSVFVKLTVVSMLAIIARRNGAD
jgi:hypothetical protein